MRVTDNLITEQYINIHNKISERKLKIQTQLANNSRLDKLTDDLSDSLDSIKLNSQIRKYEVFKKNIDSSKDFLNMSVNALDNISTEIQKIMQVAVQAEDPLNVNNFATFYESVKSSLQGIIQNLNTEHSDMYLFGGTNYSAKPFDIAADRAVVNSTDLTGEIKVQINQNVKDTINITGDKIVNSDLLDTVNDILDSLQSGVAPGKALRDRLTNAYNEILSIQSSAGEKINRLDDISITIDKQMMNAQELLGKKQEIDVPALVIELQNQDYLLQLSYKLSASILPKSLLDYL